MNKVTDWAKAHPKLTMWVVLGLGMVAIIGYEARDVGLLAGQWVALVVATMLVAGLCVWIIGWEDDEDDEAQDGDSKGGASKEGAPKEGVSKSAPAEAAAKKAGNGKKK